jgi:hypothetical protein
LRAHSIQYNNIKPVRGGGGGGGGRRLERGGGVRPNVILKFRGDKIKTFEKNQF